MPDPAQFSTRNFPISFTVNGGHVHPDLGQALRPPGERGPYYGPWVPAHDPHEPWEYPSVVSTLCFQIDATKVTLWDKEGLSSEFKTLLLRCLPFAEKAPGKRRGRAELMVILTKGFGPYLPTPPPGTTYEARRAQEDPTRWEIHMQVPPDAPLPKSLLIPPEDWRVITVLVNMGEVTKHDINRLTNDLKGVLDHWLPQAPNTPRFKSALPESYHDGLGRHNPIELDFLHNVTPQNFYRDLRRYDLCMAYRVPYRLIAYLEARERKGLPIPATPSRKRVKFKVRGEDSVEESVKRIYRAIHRQGFYQRPGYVPEDGPDHGTTPAGEDANETLYPKVSPLSCSVHGRDCPPDCARFIDWWARVEPTLQTDRTGQGREILM